jgi:general L-amino acid transport system permease protein
MAQSTAPPPLETKSSFQTFLSFIFDVRVLGVIGQMVFIVLVVIFAREIGQNFATNANRLGASQFICRDGSSSYRCAYDFMDNEAGFPISDTVLEYNEADSFWYAFYLGILNTLKVAILGVILTSILGTVAGIARLSTNWLLSKVALWYIELVRNTPLLIQLFFIYFGVILAAPALDEALQPLGLPIFLSQRGLNLPSFEFTSSASIWIAFLVLGIIQFQVTWIFLGRREERTGQSSNRIGTGLIVFLIVVGIGWFISSAVSDTQGLLVTKASRVRELEDIEQLMLQRTGINHLDDIDLLSAEELDAAALNICVLNGSPSETNLTSQLRRMGIPYNIDRSNRPDQATAEYAEGGCEMFAASKSILAAERSTLETPTGHLIVPIKENPIVLSIPEREGLNMVGGTSLRPEFAALLLTLVLFYGGTLAEIVRAGIQSVSKGQSEAARALGLSEGQRLQLVVLPQALRVIIPPGIGVFLSLAKDTSVGIAIGFPDMYSVSFTTMNQSGRTLQLFLLMMLVYMLISLVFSVLLNWYNERIKLVER